MFHSWPFCRSCDPQAAEGCLQEDISRIDVSQSAGNGSIPNFLIMKATCPVLPQANSSPSANLKDNSACLVSDIYILPLPASKSRQALPAGFSAVRVQSEVLQPPVTSVKFDPFQKGAKVLDLSLHRASAFEDFMNKGVKREMAAELVLPWSQVCWGTLDPHYSPEMWSAVPDRC